MNQLFSTLGVSLFEQPRKFTFRMVLVLTITLFLFGCNSDDVAEFIDAITQEEVSDNGDFVVQAQESSYIPDSKKLFMDMGQGIANDLNDLFKLPKGNILLSFKECGFSNAYYNPAEVELVMCHELLLDFFGFYGAETDDFLKAYFFVFFHELGHALIDQFDLPVLGKEEDSVDGMATVVMTRANMPEAAILAGYYFHNLQSGEQVNWFDSHSVGTQRMANLVCWAIGGKPDYLLTHPQLMDFAQQVIVIGQRDCQAEYQQQEDAIKQLWEPYVK